MPRFYIDHSEMDGSLLTYRGEDVGHIRHVLRYQEGDELELCDGAGTDYTAVISRFEGDAILCEVTGSRPSKAELPAKITLFQGLPKSDKLEWIIQKAVELGVCEIIPVKMARCVVKIENAAKEEKKRERWQAIARSAAKQSGRGVLPEVGAVLSFEKALEKAVDIEYNMLPYEKESGMAKSRKILEEAFCRKSIGIFIGPEGGFTPEETEAAAKAGVHLLSLGRRILRTETAGLTVLSLLMFNLEP